MTAIHIPAGISSNQLEYNGLRMWCRRQMSRRLCESVASAQQSAVRIHITLVLRDPPFGNAVQLYTVPTTLPRAYPSTKAYTKPRNAPVQVTR